MIKKREKHVTIIQGNDKLMIPKNILEYQPTMNQNNEN